jgi:hypothetical protein
MTVVSLLMHHLHGTNDSLRCSPLSNTRLATGTRCSYGARLSCIGLTEASTAWTGLTILGVMTHTASFNDGPSSSHLLGTAVLIAAVGRAIACESKLQSSVVNRASSQSVLVSLVVFEVSFFAGALWTYGTSLVTDLASTHSGLSATAGVTSGNSRTQQQLTPVLGPSLGTPSLALITLVAVSILVEWTSRYSSLHTSSKQVTRNQLARNGTLSTSSTTILPNGTSKRHSMRYLWLAFSSPSSHASNR